MEVIGYLHVLVQKVQLKESTNPIHAKISLGQVAKVDTTSKPSGSTFNDVFLIEVPEDPSRLVIACHQDQNKKGECRYDVKPFYEHQGKSHTIESSLYDDENEITGSLKMKVTFYSSDFGKLRIRIFHLQFVNQLIEQFKEAKVKARLGIYAQSTGVRDLGKPFDEIIQLVILDKGMNLTFDVVHDQGVLATYTIKNIEESNIIQTQSKAYQVNLFNQSKAVGLIKYQIDWIQKKNK